MDNDYKMGMIMDAFNRSEKLKNALNNLDKAIDNKREKEMIEVLNQYKNAHTPKIKEYKIGRNEPCPCGSGKKFKNCCINKEKYKKYI